MLLLSPLAQLSSLHPLRLGVTAPDATVAPASFVEERASNFARADLVRASTPASGSFARVWSSQSLIAEPSANISPFPYTLSLTVNWFSEFLRRRSAEKQPQDVQAEVAKALEAVEIMMEVRERSVQFVVDQDSGADVIKVVDDNTGEVIRQIPTDELLGFMRNLTKMLGNFLDERV